MLCRRLLRTSNCFFQVFQSRCLLTASVGGGGSSIVGRATSASTSGLHTSAVNLKTGFYKITEGGDLPLTYEQANPPYKIGVTKAWNTWNASTLRNPGHHPMNTAAEDDFIRKFIQGTWYKIWISEVIIKRQHNNITICGIICPLPSPMAVHFLTGYTEELLSQLFKSNVKVWVQAVDSKLNTVYKRI